MKTLMTKIAGVGMAVATIALVATPLAQAAAPSYDVSGDYVVAMNYLGNDYAHDMSLTQDNVGNLTGNGGSPAGGNVYTWVITSGTVSGNTVDFLANYTATPDAVTPQTVLHVTGTVAADGSISGTWSDNYQGGSRSGTFESVVGAAALAGSLTAEDFGVVSYDTGLGMLKGYTAGFGLASTTFAGATSVEVKLYSGATLLQTNTAILPKFNADITGMQFSSPFDVSGTFAYATDGYWTNVREAQYGQSVPATRVVATVTLANGKVVTAENTVLTGDPATIYPAATYTLTYTAGAHGTLTGSTTQSVSNGADGTAVTAVADVDYHFVNWSDTSTANPRADTDVSGDITVTANFAADSVVDTTPNTFAFVDQTGIALSTVVESNQVTITGINAATAISVTGGEYSVNGGAYTAVAGTVVSGDTVKVRHTSSASNSTNVNTALTVGGVSDTFTSTTVAVPVVTPPTDKNACKNGGWMTLESSLGFGFKNQGACVSFVATGGKVH